MSSFYGNHGVGGGTGGTSDYNQLLNKPFTNLIGGSSSPIIFETLDFGNYMVKGSFIYVAGDTAIKEASYLNYIEILQDSASKKKVAKYETFEDGKYYIYTVYFNGDGTCVVDKILINKSEGLVFLKEEEMPQEGIESVLYVTGKTIYQYKDGNFIDMNAPQWGTF